MNTSLERESLVQFNLELMKKIQELEYNLADYKKKLARSKCPVEIKELLNLIEVGKRQIEEHSRIIKEVDEMIEEKNWKLREF